MYGTMVEKIEPVILLDLGVIMVRMVVEVRGTEVHVLDGLVDDDLNHVLCSDVMV